MRLLPPNPDAAFFARRGKISATLAVGWFALAIIGVVLAIHRGSAFDWVFAAFWALFGVSSALRSCAEFRKSARAKLAESEPAGDAAP